MAEQTYTAAAIMILDEAEVADRFGWARAERIADQYPGVARSFVRRLIQAAVQSGEDEAGLIRRYLGRDKTAPPPSQGFLDVFRELADQREDRSRG